MANCSFGCDEPLLRQLRAYGATIYRHSDFDPAGLAISTWLAERTGTVPWCMNAADYCSAIRSGDRTRPRFRGGVPATPWDPALSVAMESAGDAVYEEEVRISPLDGMQIGDRSRPVRSAPTIFCAPSASNKFRLSAELTAGIMA
jgi:hypothetical protein